jgi:serine/threonine-protein kinase HipA
MAEREVQVWVQIRGEDVLAGRLWSHRRRGAESQTFSYDVDYIARRDAYELDPALQLVVGQQQTPAERRIFGAFSDAAPDRWGRRLITRTEKQRVKREGGAEKSFGETDYLLGVRDDLRQGALRFRAADSDVFLADEIEGIPYLLELPRLLRAADSLERDEASEDELRTLLRGGSSLGGARPKAHVLDADGRISIAKFPSPASDDWDVMRWESVTLQLARDSGIRVPDSALHLIDGQPVLVVRRFDRVRDQRVGYVSAMTMLEFNDGDRGTYVEIADVIERFSPSATEDLRQLWRRAAFSVLVSNFDDHLRNHGFLRTTSAGWSLSPAFDLNPDPRPGPRLLSTSIDYGEDEARVDTLMSVADYFRLDGSAARTVLKEVGAATAKWRLLAREAGLRDVDLEQMEPAFEHEQAAIVRDL